MKPILGFEGYSADERGNIFSSRPMARYSVPPIVPRLLKPAKSGSGYWTVRLCKNGKSFTKSIHTLILETFVGPCPEGMEACHNDGNRTNNVLSNLRWDTRRNNHLDKKDHGTWQCGENHGCAKLNESEVLKIRELSELGVKRSEIAGAFNVAYTTVGHIVLRLSWAHI